MEGTAGKQRGAKGGSAEAAERNPEQSLERHLETSRSLDQQLLGIWRTVQLVQPPRALARARTLTGARARARARARTQVRAVTWTAHTITCPLM